MEKNPHREPTNLCNWGKEAWKKRASMGFEPMTSMNTDPPTEL